MGDPNQHMGKCFGTAASHDPLMQFRKKETIVINKPFLKSEDDMILGNVPFNLQYMKLFSLADTGIKILGCLHSIGFRILG